MHFYTEIVCHKPDGQVRTGHGFDAEDDWAARRHAQNLADKMHGTVDYISYTQTIVVYENPEFLK